MLGENLESQAKMDTSLLPCWPEGYQYQTLPPDHPIMMLGQETALRKSSDKLVKTGSVLFRGDSVLGLAANYSPYHVENKVCERIRLNCPTGQGYELCPGCSWENHSERNAILDALNKGHNVKGASLALWGHHYPCKPCCDIIVEQGIGNLYVMQGSYDLFRKESPNCIFGRHFEIYGRGMVND